jgi:hypothetical protein
VFPVGCLLANLRLHFNVNVAGRDLETLCLYLCTELYSVYGLETWSGGNGATGIGVFRGMGAINSVIQ